MRTPRLTAVLFGAALAAAGCSSSTGGSESASTSSSQPFSCASVPASEVSATLGAQYGAPTSTVSGTTTLCTYHLSSGIGTTIVRVQAGTTRAGFDASRSQFTSRGEAVSDVAGLGTEAFSSTTGTPPFDTSTVVALSGSTQVQVSSGPGIALSKVEALARQIVAKV